MALVAFMALVSLGAESINDEKPRYSFADKSELPMPENGAEGQETFDQALVENMRSGIKKGFLLDVEYEDVYVVAEGVGKNADGTFSSIGGRKVFAADKYQEAVEFTKNNEGWGMLNGSTSSEGAVTIYRSATHAAYRKMWIRNLLGDIEGVKNNYTNLENAIHTIAHEIYHRRFDVNSNRAFDHGHAYGEGHRMVEKYRRRIGENN